MKQTIFPVITLYQPWATWVVRGLKTIETRLHTKFACLKLERPLIHAGKITDETAWEGNYHVGTEAMSWKYPNGAIIGQVSVDEVGSLNSEHSKAAMIDCHESFNRFGLFLSNPVKFDEPIPEKGSMGIWYYDLKNQIKVHKQEYLLEQIALMRIGAAKPQETNLFRTAPDGSNEWYE